METMRCITLGRSSVQVTSRRVDLSFRQSQITSVTRSSPWARVRGKSAAGLADQARRAARRPRKPRAAVPRLPPSIDSRVGAARWR